MSDTASIPPRSIDLHEGRYCLRITVNSNRRHVRTYPSEAAALLALGGWIRRRQALRRHPWRVRISLNRRIIHAGDYPTESKALRALARWSRTHRRCAMDGPLVSPLGGRPRRKEELPKGIYLEKGQYRVRWRVGGKLVQIGYYRTEAEAAAALEAWHRRRAEAARKEAS